MWKYLEDNHLFAPTYEPQTLDEVRELAVRRIYNIFEKEFVTLADVSVSIIKCVPIRRESVSILIV